MWTGLNTVVSNNTVDVVAQLRPRAVRGTADERVGSTSDISVAEVARQK